jgi:quercetin dioxygenase-like cupin family protein
MQLIKGSDGIAYHAPGHAGIAMRRLVGVDAPADAFVSVMHLHYEAQGYVERSSSADQKIYFCVSGEVAISNGDETVQMMSGDVCIIAADEPREIVNCALTGSELLLIMPRK